MIDGVQLKLFETEQLIIEKKLCLVPVYIRPHLVNYLYDLFPAEKDSYYCGTKAKSVRVTVNSPLGKYIRSACVKSGYPEKVDKYNFFFSVDEKKTLGELYSCKSGTYHFLHFPPEFVVDLNDMLESMFQMSMFYFIEGYRMTGDFGGLSKAIHLFIEKYDLYEHGFTYDSLIKRYMRISKDNLPFKPLIQQQKNQFSFTYT